MQPEESEWQTRKARIDQRLRALSPAWQIVRYHPGLDLPRLTCHVVEELPTDSGPADYGFFADRPLQRIREFRNRPNPKIVVTVDMLSTRVDIPALEFIVFLRPVKSRILLERMLGRGTRLCPDINKSKFVMSDCFDGTLIHYFRNVSRFDIIDSPRTSRADRRRRHVSNDPNRCQHNSRHVPRTIDH